MRKLLLSVLLFWSLLAQAQYVREDFDETTSSSAGNTVSVANTAVGDCLLAIVSWASATNTLDSITVTSESNMTLIGSPQGGGPSSDQVQWAILDDITTSGAKDVVATFSAANQSLMGVWRLSGCNPGSMVDVSNATNGTGTNPSVSLTTTVANAAVFGYVTNNGSESATNTGAGYTDEPIANYQWYATAEYDLDVGATGSKTVDFTNGTSSTYVITAIALDAGAGGGGPSLQIIGHNRRRR